MRIRVIFIDLGACIPLDWHVTIAWNEMNVVSGGNGVLTSGIALPYAYLRALRECGRTATNAAAT